MSGETDPSTGAADGWWVDDPTGDDDARAAEMGLRPGREILQMRRALPIEESSPVEVRPFRPGLDDDAWLEVNNRAFAWHPDQGGWTGAQLDDRQAESWFDPHGFLLHHEDGRLAGFCWTKVHSDPEPPVGEIFVIAVDPDFVGHGLGRALVLAGLDYLARQGLTVGMLYVEADNEVAIRLYESLGFTVHHVRRQYVA